MKILEVKLNGELRLNLNTVLLFITFILRTIMAQINVHIDIQLQKKKSFINYGMYYNCSYFHWFCND